MGKAEDLTGRRFDRIVVVSRNGTRDSGATWNCRCDCGTVKVVRAHTLKNGHTRSCGCLARETAAALLTTHGRGRTPEHQAWKDMLLRCTDTERHNYPRYGGRGIYVCPRWAGDFVAFLADVGERPSPKHQVDRIKTAGSYTCGKCDDCVSRGAILNVRWVTPQEQQNNRSNNRHVTVHGERMTVAQAARKYDVDAKRILYRLRRGWPDDNAVLLPAHRWAPPGGPGLSIEVRHVLAGAYHGRPRTLLTHAAEVRDGEVIRVLCGHARIESLCDAGATAPDETVPTCPSCARRMKRPEPPAPPATDDPKPNSPEDLGWPRRTA